MRAVSLLLILSLFATLFCGCSGEGLTLEGYEWQLSWAKRLDPETNEWQDLPCESVFLTAENGLITINDLTNGKVYSGVYIESGRNADGYDYTLTVGGFSGHATVAYTTYRSGEKIPTLPISLMRGSEQYTLQFQAKQP